MSSSGQVFIALVNLGDYYKFITDENRNLIKYIFESNVRDYQGKTTVNNEIQETLEKSESSEEFWWLNNGVTIIATEASAPGGKEITITNPEIVNGLSNIDGNFPPLFSQSREITERTKKSSCKDNCSRN
ncbi:AIPR family protein [Paenibacillus ihbetae]